MKTSFLKAKYTPMSWKTVARDDLQFIFGIPTINRKNENYLYDTIDSLLNGLNNFETKREPCFKMT